MSFIQLLLELFASFFKIGMFTIGGGYAMIPLIQETVLEKGWLTSEILTDFIAISESTPGPFAVNIATFIGQSQAGILGAVIATLGVVLPSFLIILLIAKFFTKFNQNFYVKSALVGVRPAVIALITIAVFDIAKGNLFNEFDLSGLDWRPFVMLAIISAIRIKFKKIHPVWLVLISAGLGIVFYMFI